MKAFLSIFLSLLLLLPLLLSCGETPQTAPSSSENGAESASASEPATEEPSEPETDPFEGADPLPDGLAVPSSLKTPDGGILGTIVLTKAGEEDVNLAFAAQDLQYLLQKVLGDTFPIVSRTGEGYGSLILATPASLPAVAEMFEDDIAWLSDLGTKESGKWGSDGFAIRLVGGNIWIIGNTSKGAMNGVYDLIEDNLGVLCIRADESEGLIYDELEEATVSKVDYREKSPIPLRGWMFGSEKTNALMLARNKLNSVGDVPEYGMLSFSAGHTIKGLLTSSPLYDPEETEYWETDDEGNSLGLDGSRQVNPWSDKVADAVAASVIARMRDTGTRYVFVGEEDWAPPYRCVPYDELPFEYAPGQFVNPEDRNFYSTVFHTMINKIARQVKEAFPDGWIGTFAYEVALAPPACDMEDNVRICYAPIREDMTHPILDQSILERVSDPQINCHCTFIPEWNEKVQSMVFYHYYGCNAHGAQFSWPIWQRIQADLKSYVLMGVDGVGTDGFRDQDIGNHWMEINGAKGTCSNYWDMNHLMCWLYAKLLWNPDEDIPSLISYFCDKVYGDASPYMQEYYRLMEGGFAAGSETFGARTCNLKIHPTDFYKQFVVKQGIGHGLLDNLELAYNTASGPIKETIQYMWETVRTNLNSFRTF